MSYAFVGDSAGKTSQAVLDASVLPTSVAEITSQRIESMLDIVVARVLRIVGPLRYQLLACDSPLCL